VYRRHRTGLADADGPFAAKPKVEACAAHAARNEPGAVEKEQIGGGKIGLASARLDRFENERAFLFLALDVEVLKPVPQRAEQTKKPGRDSGGDGRCPFRGDGLPLAQRQFALFPLRLAFASLAFKVDAGRRSVRAPDITGGFWHLFSSARVA
jgi:hypothetical protein